MGGINANPGNLNAMNLISQLRTSFESAGVAQNVTEGVARSFEGMGGQLVEFADRMVDHLGTEIVQHGQTTGPASHPREGHGATPIHLPRTPDELGDVPLPLPKPTDELGGLPIPIPQPTDELGATPIHLPRTPDELGDVPLPLPKPTDELGGLPIPIPKPTDELGATPIHLPRTPDEFGALPVPVLMPFEGMAVSIMEPFPGEISQPPQHSSLTLMDSLGKATEKFSKLAAEIGRAGTVAEDPEEEEEPIQTRTPDLASQINNINQLFVLLSELSAMLPGFQNR